MADKIDYKKKYKDLYLPKDKPVLIDVPVISFIMIDGKGTPNSFEYQKAIQALYCLSYTIKMSRMSGNSPEGYFDYVVPPLEGFWEMPDGSFDTGRPDLWKWTAMIRLPEFADKRVFEWAVEECKRKKPEIDVSKARFETFKEGLCVQIMHIGPYSKEQYSLDRINEFISENNLIEDIGPKRRHHEIYISDPRKTLPEKLKTVLRIPVRRA